MNEAVLIAEHDKRGIRRVIRRLALPSLSEMLLMNVSQMLNMILVGRVGAEAIAAVGLTSQPYLLFMVLFASLNIGTSVIVARSIGAGDIEQANQVIGQTLVLNLIISIVLGGISSLFAEQILLLVGANQAISDTGLSYARILFLCIGFTAIAFVLSAALRGAGNTRTPMIINVLAHALEVSLAFLLIYGHAGLPALGITGAAIANVAGRSVAAFLFIGVLLSRKYPIRIAGRRMFSMNRASLARVLRIGLPASGEQLVMRLGIMMFVMISATLGTMALAANQIITNIIAMSFIPGTAFGTAAATLMGQSLGAGKVELAEAYVWQIRRYGMLIAGIMGFVIMLFAPYLLMLYTTEPTIVEQGTAALRIVGAIQLSQASQFIIGGALRGAGDTKYPLYSTLIGVWGVRVLFSFVFVFGLRWGLTGLWMAVALDQLLRSFLIYRRFRTQRWRNIQI